MAKRRMVLHKEHYRYFKGEEIHLDTIYNVQGLGDEHELGGRWWEPLDGAEGDNLIITRDIEFTITFYETI